MKAEIVRLEVYPCYLCVVVGRGNIGKALDKIGVKYTNDEKEVEFALNSEDMAFTLDMELPYYPNAAQKLLGWHSAKIYLIWIGAIPRTARQLSTVGHECIHLKNMILKFMGQKRLSLVDDENEAYMFDYIFKKVLESARRK